MGIEFVKHFRSHLGPICGLAVSVFVHFSGLLCLDLFNTSEPRFIIVRSLVCTLSIVHVYESYSKTSKLLFHVEVTTISWGQVKAK